MKFSPSIAKTIQHYLHVHNGIDHFHVLYHLLGRLSVIPTGSDKNIEEMLLKDIQRSFDAGVR